MTKNRQPESIEDAALEIAAWFGVDACGRIVGGLTGAAIRAWTDPDRPGRPTLHQAVLLDAAFAVENKGRLPFLSAYQRQAQKLIKGATPVVEGVLEEALDVSAAVGQAMEAIRQACSADSPRAKGLTSAEVRDALKKIKKAGVELDELKAAINAAGPTARRPTS